MICVEGRKAHSQRKLQLYTVAGLPRAAYRGKLAGNSDAGLTRPVHIDFRSLRPGWNAECIVSSVGCEAVTVMTPIFIGILAFCVSESAAPFSIQRSVDGT